MKVFNIIILLLCAVKLVIFDLCSLYKKHTSDLYYLVVVVEGGIGDNIH